MEGALKMIRAHGNAISPSKIEIISLENSFHGRTLGALSITGQPKYREDFEPLLPGVRFVERNNIAALEAAFNANTAGIVLEFIQGEGGIYPISEAFARRAHALPPNTTPCWSSTKSNAVSAAPALISLTNCLIRRVARYRHRRQTHGLRSCRWA